MSDHRDVLVDGAPQPAAILAVDSPDVSTRRRRSRRVLAVVSIVVAVMAVVSVIVIDKNGRDSVNAVTAGTDSDVAVRSWSVPGVHRVAVVGDDVWVLVGSGGRQWFVGRLDEATGDVVERRPVAGSLLDMTASGRYLWVWGQAFSAQLQERLDSGNKELLTSGRAGVVHRIEPGRDTQSWSLDTFPTFLAANDNEAWGAMINYDTNAWSLARFGDGDDVETTPSPNADWGIFLDGDRIWLNGSADLVALDRRSGRVLERYESRRLIGRTSDGRLWETASASRVAPFVPGKPRSKQVLYATGDATVRSMVHGVVIGRRWFADPGAGPESDAELVLPSGLTPSNAFVPADRDVVYYAVEPLSVNGPAGAVYRWVPSADRIDPASRPPLVEPPATIDIGECAPFADAFLTDDAGDWAESSIPDPDLPGAVRRTGPAGAYVQAYPGPAPWLPATPTSSVQPSEDAIAEEYIARTPDGYAGRAVLTGGPRPEPCNTLNLIGHGVSPEELQQQLLELSYMLPSAERGQTHA